MPIATPSPPVRFEGPVRDYLIELLSSGVVRISLRGPAGPSDAPVLVANPTELIFSDATFSLNVTGNAEESAQSGVREVQVRPNLTPLADGTTLLSWMAPRQDTGAESLWSLWARLQAADGSRIGEAFKLADYQAAGLDRSLVGGPATAPDRIAALPEGGFIAAWRAARTDQSGWQVLVQRFNGQGDPLTAPTPVDSGTDNQPEQPGVTALADGRIVLTWAAPRPGGAGHVVQTQVLTADGKAISGVQTVSADTDVDRSAPTPVALLGGGFALVWNESGATGHSVALRVYDAKGEAVGAVQRLPATNGAALQGSAATPTPDGGFAVVYESRSSDGTVHEIRLLRLDHSGRALGEPSLVNEPALNRSLNAWPSVAAAANGQISVAWSSYESTAQGWEVKLRVLDGKGVPLASSLTVNQASTGQQVQPDVSVLPDGRPMVVWQSLPSESGTWFVTNRAALTPTGQMAEFTLLGTAGPDRLALPGAQRIDGGAGADTMIGGAEDTTYVMDVTEDQVVEASGGGTDTILSSAPLRMPEHVENLRLLGEEPLKAWGSEGPNRMQGNAAANVLDGGGGADEIDGGAGDDTLLGGTGNDTLRGGDGADRLIDRQGTNLTEGGAGDDFLDLGPASQAAGIADGGPGEDRVILPLDAQPKVQFRSIEVLDADGLPASPAILPWLRAQGFQNIVNLVLQTPPQVKGTNPDPASRVLDVSDLRGPVTLVGTRGSDRLTGNNDANRIELLSEVSNGTSEARDTVRAGGGDDTIVWAMQANRPALESFSGVDASTRRYALNVDLDGAAGQDTLALDFSATGWTHAWAQSPVNPQEPSDWTLDLSGASIQGIEHLVFSGYKADRPGLFPAIIMVSPQQAATLQSVEGLDDALTEVRVNGLDAIAEFLVGTPQADRLTGGDGADLINGGPGADTLQGGPGNDLLVPGSGANLVDGGLGIDSVYFAGPKAGYRVEVDTLGRTLTVTDTSGEKSTLTDAEWLLFEDGPLPGLRPMDLDAAYRLFIVTFGAAPGADVMLDLIKANDAGLSPLDVAQHYTRLLPFIEEFSPSLSPAAFAQRLVERTVGDLADPAVKASAMTEITQALENGGSRGQALLWLAQSLKDPQWGEAGQLLANQVAVARYHAQILREPGQDIEVLRAVLSWVTPSTDASSTQAIRAVFRNTPPTFEQLAVPGTISGPEDQPLEFSVRALDAETPGQLSYSVGQAQSGAVSVNPEGRVRYLPRPDFNGQDVVVITATDPSGATATLTVPLRVEPVNDAPVPVADPVARVIVGQSVTLDVAANDRDPDGQRPTLGTIVQVNQGRATVVNGQLVYEAPAGFLGTARVVYTINDGLQSVQASQIIEIVPALVKASAASVSEGQSLTISVDGAPLTAYRVSLGGTARAGLDYDDSDGELLITTDERGSGTAQLVFARDKTTEGTESLTVRLSGQEGVLNISVGDTSLNNQAPVFGLLPQPTTNEDEVLRMPLPLAQDANAEDVLNYSIVSAQGGRAELVLGSGGSRSVWFVPTPDFTGKARVTLRADDGTARTDATIEVTVTPVNDAPTVDLNGSAAGTDVRWSYSENQSARILAPAAVLADIDSTQLESAVVSITNAQSGDMLGFSIPSGSGIRGAYDPASGELRLGGSALLSQYQAVIRSLTYYSTSENPSTSPRLLSVQVGDGNPVSGSSIAASIVISVSTTNDPPVLDLNGAAPGTGATLAYLENQVARPIAPLATIRDQDSLLLGGATVTLSSPLPEERLEYTPGDGVGVSGSYDPATGVLTLAGSASVAVYEAALRSVSYVNSSDNPGTATRSLLIQVSDGQPANSLSAAVRAAVTVTAVNDAPTALLSGDDQRTPFALNQPEQLAAQPIAPSLVLQDPDSNSLSGATVTISNVQPEDVLSFTSPAGSGITGVYVPATGALTLTGVAPLAAYQAAVRAVSYFNAADNPNTEPRIVRLQLNDGANANNLGTVTLATISITPINDTPVVDLNGAAAGLDTAQAYVENQSSRSLTPSLVLSDVDSLRLSQATVTIVNPLPEDLLSFTASADSGITGVYNAATGALTLTGLATLSQYQAALRSVAYNNTSDNPNLQPRVVTFLVTDEAASNAASGPATVTVSVAPVNDAPVLRLAGASSSAPVAAAYRENQDPLPIAPDLVVEDIDSTTLAGATVTITNMLPEDVLSFTAPIGSAIAGAYAPATGVLTLSGIAPLVQYEAVLRTVAYRNTSDNPSTTPRTIAFVLNDGANPNNLSLARSASVTTTPVNDAPSVDLNGVAAGVDTTLAYTENQIGASLLPALVITDVDSTRLTRATVTITNPLPEDVLSFITPAGSGLTGTYNAASATLTISGTSSLSQYQAALRTVTYRNTSDNPNTTVRVVSVVISDDASAQADSAPAAASISFIPVNDPPVLTLSASAPSPTTEYRENQEPQAVAPDLIIDDPDSTTLAGATVTISNVLPEDVLSFTAPAGSPITATYAPATGTLTLVGVATLAQYQAALRTVAYRNTSENPVTTPRTVSIVLNDGANPNNLSTTRNASVTITSVNDAPAVDLNGAGTGTGAVLRYTDNQLARPVAPQSTLSDVDSLNALGAVVTITNVRPEDVLSFTAPAGNAITGSYTASTGVLTLAGNAPLAQYQAALRSITYTNTSAAPNTTTRLVTVQINDGANAGLLSTVAEAQIQISAGPGNDSMTGTSGNDVLLGGAGRDTLNAGLGNDTLEGGPGNDLYILGNGVENWFTSDDTISDESGDADVLQLTLLPESPALVDGVYANVRGIEQIVVSNAASVTFTLGALAQTAGINNVTLATGNTLAAGGYTTNLRVTGAGGDESITTGSGTDTITDGDGNDSIQSGDGNDSIQLGSGTDRVDLGGGDDVILIGRGLDPDDVLTGGTGNDRLRLNASNVVTAGVGGTALMTFDATYTQVTGFESMALLAGLPLQDASSGPDTPGTVNRYSISLTSAHVAAGAVFSVDGSALRSAIVFNLGADGQIGGAPNSADADQSLDESLNFSAVGLALGAGAVSVVGGAGSDTLNGSPNADTLSGGGGADVINGGGGADSLVGGAGNDTLNGGAGQDSMDGGADADTYLVVHTATQDTELIAGELIADTGSASDVDVLLVTATAPIVDAVFTNKRGIESLVIAPASTDSLSITLGTNAQAAGIVRVTLDAGAILAGPTYSVGLNITEGEATGNESITTGSGADTITSRTGNDTVLSGAGDDTITLGGSGLFGTISLNGGDGNDLVQVFTLALLDQALVPALSAADRLDGGLGTDTLQLTGNAPAGSVQTTTISFGDTLVGFERLLMSPGSNAVDNIGTDTAGSADDYAITLGAAQNVAAGTVMTVDARSLRASVVTGLGANGAIGGGDDTVTAENLTFSAAAVAGAVSVLGGAASDTITGSANADTLQGFGGDDSLVGGNGVDLLAGGAGNDTLNGGDGADRYVFNSGDAGVDTLLAAGLTAGPVGGDVLDFSGIALDRGRAFYNGSGYALLDPAAHSVMVLQNDALGNEQALQTALNGLALWDQAAAPIRILVVWEINASTVGYGIVTSSTSADDDGVGVELLGIITGFANQAAVDAYTAALVAANFTGI